MADEHQTKRTSVRRKRVESEGDFDVENVEMPELSVEQERKDNLSVGEDSSSTGGSRNPDVNQMKQQVSYGSTTENVTSKRSTYSAVGKGSVGRPLSVGDDGGLVGDIGDSQLSDKRPSERKSTTSLEDLESPIYRSNEEAEFSIDSARNVLASLSNVGLLSRDEEVRLSAIVQELQAREQLSPEEELILAEAKERFVSANLRLVASIARRMHGGSVPLEDLIQEGNIGLMRAVELFDGRKGFRFSTYATWWIRQAISQAIGEFRSEISLPRSLLQDYQRIQQTRLDLQQKLGREPRLDEVAEACGIELFRVEEILMYAQSVLSLEASPISDNGSESMLGDVVPDSTSPPIEGTVVSQDLGRVVQIVLEQLDERERAILIYRFGLNGEEPHSIEQASERFGVSRERVRQVEARAISRLRRNESTQALREILQDG